MNILVLLKMVPDVVEELELADSGKALDTEFLRMIANERDEHALEQALLMKEKYGGRVTVAAPEAHDVDDVLWIALARGADRAIRVTGIDDGAQTRWIAAALAHTLSAEPDLWPLDLVLVGCQAIDDLDGQLAPGLARQFEMPYLGLVTAIDAQSDTGRATVIKEFAGGRRGEYEVVLPAVLGIQAAEKPPRYVPVAKVRAVRQSQSIDERAAVTGIDVPVTEILQMVKPKPSTRAQMLDGSPAEVATAVGDILRSRGLLPGGA